MDVDNTKHRRTVQVEVNKNMSGYKLRRYQQQAVTEVLSGIEDAQRLFITSEASKRSAVILSAPTGAGKTVMAGTVIDTLLSAATEDESAPETVILWVTDAPALNRQSATKIEKASSNRVKTVVLSGSGADFDQETFDPGVLYLLNVQAAGKNAGLSNHSDARTYSIWDTISNTALEYGPNFIVIIDEAHRGAKKSKQQAGEDDTIVGQITDAAPVVFGISATEQRFRDRMKEKRRELFPVDVSVTDVSGEGMIKTTLILKKPSEKDAHITMLRHAVQDTLDFESRWARHDEGKGDPILPALIVQVRNGSLAPKRPEDEDGFREELTEFIKAILDEWEGLEPENIINVFGEHETLELGEHNGNTLRIAYMRPDDIDAAVNVEGKPDVRVVIAKDAITTGWDCPRAEVLVSYRTAKDETYITQLIGRMIRNPLAHTVQSDDFLNNAHCTLPYFDREELERLTKKLKDEDGIEARISDAEPVTYERAESLDEGVFKALESISSYHIPRRNDTYYLGLLRYLAGNLAVDGIVDDAAEKTDQFLCQKLDSVVSKKPTKFADLLAKSTVSIDRWNMKMVEDSEEEYGGTEIIEMDIADVVRKYGLSNQVFGDGFRETYIKYLVESSGIEVEEAKRRVMVLSEDTFEARAELEGASKKRFLKLLKDNADAISKLESEERRTIYANIMEESDEPTLRRIAEAPVSIQENIDGELLRKARNFVVEQTYEEARARVIANTSNHYDRNIYTSKEVGNGKYLAKFNRWEREVLRIELTNPACRGWYRNPPQGQRSVAIKYIAKDGAWAGIHPDFILFHEVDGVIKPSIADPHGNHLEDFVIKMRGWHEYAVEHHGEFHTLRPSTEWSHELRYLELTDSVVRDALGVELTKDDPHPMRVFRDHGKAYRWQGTAVQVSADDLAEEEVSEPPVAVSVPSVPVIRTAPRGISGEAILLGITAEVAPLKGTSVLETEKPVEIKAVLKNFLPDSEDAAADLLTEEINGIIDWVSEQEGGVDRSVLALEIGALLELLELEKNDDLIGALCESVFSRV
jgi:superfamily II DNA or RNA helicase